MNSLLRCPVCSEQTLLEGEKVDVGFDLYYGVKCGPDTCDNCGYIEADPDPNDLSIEHYKECWKNGLDPYPIFPTMKPLCIPQFKNWDHFKSKWDTLLHCQITKST